MITTNNGTAEQRNKTLKEIPIDEFLFMPRFSADPIYSTHEFLNECYLDKQSGGLLWINESWEDDLNQETYDKLSSDPTRYIEIGFSDHGFHHGLLREFLETDWTDNDELRKKAANSYVSSIGEWTESMEATGARWAFDAYKEERFKQLAEEFLAEHGIKPIWQ